MKKKEKISSTDLYIYL